MVAPPSLDYIPDFEEPQTPLVPQDEDECEPMFIQPHDPDYVLEPIYPEYITLEDEHEFPVEEQPLPPVDSPTAESPRYVAESDPEEDPKEYKDDETEDGPVDYPMDGRDDGDDDDGDSFGDDADDKDEDEIASTQALVDAVTAALPLPPLPPLPPSLYIPPPVDHRDDILEPEQPPHERSCLFALGSRYEIGESSTAGPTGEAVPQIAPMTVGEVNTRVIELVELHERDTQDLYALLEDAQDGDSMDCGGGGICFPRGLGSLDRIKSGDPSGASDPP
ncbi:hypothetical protein Tco_1480996 [Tanacetum coccineum]